MMLHAKQNKMQQEKKVLYMRPPLEEDYAMPIKEWKGDQYLYQIEDNADNENYREEQS